MRIQSRSLITFGLLLLPLAAVSCGSAAAPIAEEPPSSQAPASLEATLVPTMLPAATVPPPAATEPVFVGPGGQFATDPSTVDLASGRPSLVKFFAFW